MQGRDIRSYQIMFLTHEPSQNSINNKYSNEAHLLMYLVMHQCVSLFYTPKEIIIKFNKYAWEMGVK